jgi:hypothetical protein
VPARLCHHFVDHGVLIMDAPGVLISNPAIAFALLGEPVHGDFGEILRGLSDERTQSDNSLWRRGAKESAPPCWIARA